MQLPTPYKPAAGRLGDVGGGLAARRYDVARLVVVGTALVGVPLARPLVDDDELQEIGVLRARGIPDEVGLRPVVVWRFSLQTRTPCLLTPSTLSPSSEKFAINDGSSSSACSYTTGAPHADCI